MQMSELQAELVEAFIDNIRVLRQRDGEGPSDEQAQERARNYVQWLTLQFDLTRKEIPWK
jgi:hypothetical protein